MTGSRIFQALRINGINYKIRPCWELLSLTKEYMLALLRRDEYAPCLASRPANSDTSYEDPVNENPVSFHSGQHISYADGEAGDGFGLSVVKGISTDSNGIPESMSLYNATDIEKRVSIIERVVDNGCFGNGVWYNTLKWSDDALWINEGCAL